MTRPPRARDPYGVGPIGGMVAPLLALVGLVIVAIVTIQLLSGSLPFGIGSGPGNGNGGPGDPARTAAPSGVVVVPPEAAFDGAIVYAKGGNIWIQRDDDVTQLTDTGGASMPSWAPDGESVIYVETVTEETRWAQGGGREQTYILDIPSVMRVDADGGGEPELIKSGRIDEGRRTFAFWLRGPVLAPDGSSIAVVSDAPDPAESPVVLQFMDPATGDMTTASAAADAIPGHQDPEWRSDGQFVAYTRNARDGSRGASIIMRYGVENGRTAGITGPGYLQPSYSRDGRWLAATRTTTLGNDVVILNGRTGEEVLRVTADDASFNPVWSPAGDAIAYLHLSGQTVDLRLARLGGEPGAWTVEETISLTEVSGLDPESGPDWFIPEADLPPLPTPVPSSAAPSAADPEASPS